MEGWIKIYRKVRDHWIWEDANKLKWWLDILLEVNHDPKKVVIGYNIFDCNRGESIRSLHNWGVRWGVSKTVVNNFFRLLQNDGMIEVKNETVTTRLTVCNYDYYQEVQNANETQQSSTNTATEPQQSTNKNEKNEKNIILLSEISISEIEDENEKLYFQIASSFYELFLNNSKEIDVEFSNLKNAKYQEWVDSIRKLIEIDGRSQNEIREVFRFLKIDEFWKQNIRSTAKLRKKNKNGVTYFEELLIKSRNNGKRNSKGGATDQEVAEIIARTFADQN